jgi:hypothetical protein
MKNNKEITFNELDHTYFVTERPEETLTSVTKLIHKYTQSFDENFWSSYKALQAVRPDIFERSKNKLLNLKNFNINTEDFEDEFLKAKAEFINQWKRNSEESCAKGTEHHSIMEEECRKQPSDYLARYGFKGEFVLGGEDIDLSIDNAAYPEIILHRISADRKLRIAGQADLVVIEGGKYLTVLDYKSSKTIDKKSWFNPASRTHAMMLPPINTLQDCNFTHYSLQLSLYAWMILKQHPSLQVKALKIIHSGKPGKTSIIECDYMDKHVVKMLKDFKTKENE